MTRAWMRAIVFGLGLGGCGAAATYDRVEGTVVVHANDRERAAIARARERIRAADERRWAAGDEVVAASRTLQEAALALQQAGAGEAAAPLAARRDWAAWLVAERRARFEVADADAELADIELELIKLDVVQRAGAAIDVGATSMLVARKDAEHELAEARRRAAQTAGELARARDRWDQLQRAQAAAASPAGR